MQQCGFCSMLSGLLRRAMCIGSRRGSSDSYYRELGEQDTLKIDDKSSNSLEDYGDIKSGDTFDIETELCGMSSSPVATGRFLTMHKRRKKRLLTRSLCREAALLDDLHIGQVQFILANTINWRFNAFTLDNASGGRCLPVLCVHLFQMYGLLKHFKLDVAKVWKLFSLIEEGYHSSNPYHNSIHAADVTQAMHCFLQQKRIRENMEPIEVMATLIAAMAHDIDHPGVNQQFLIATSNHLAALYRNTSVLENHHWRSAISCVIESGLLDQLTDIWEKLENQISSLILATDITRQQEYLSQFKGHLDTNTLNMTRSDHRHLVLQIALKCADISNPCRPWEISRKWSLNVCDEFFRQGDYERKLNLPVTALCDRHTTSIPKIQTGFFKYVVTPLVSEWHRFLKNDLSAQMLENLLFNQAKWEMLLADELAQESLTDVSDADLADDELDTGSDKNNSGSSERLLPPRRSSLNVLKQMGLKEQLRRFSVPLNVFQDNKTKQQQEAGEGSAAGGSALSLHSQLSAGTRGGAVGAAATRLSTERLLPDTSIASITTPRQATRLNSVLKYGPTWKLLRQQTFPPLETTERLASKLYTSNEDTIYPARSKTDIGQKFVDVSKIEEGRFSRLFKRSTDRTECGDDAENVGGGYGAPRNLQKENLHPMIPRGNGNRRESAPVGSQLRDNLTAAAASQGALAPDLLLRRRKSMPTEIAHAPKEKKSLDLTSVLPGLMRRTLSGKEAWSRRRGSAPVPVAPSELRQLPALGLRHSINGGGSRRKPGPIATCQQWLAKATYSMQERTINLPRRSSLPVEVRLPTDSNEVSNEGATDAEEYETP